MASPAIKEDLMYLTQVRGHQGRAVPYRHIMRDAEVRAVVMYEDVLSIVVLGADGEVVGNIYLIGFEQRV